MMETRDERISNIMYDAERFSNCLYSDEYGKHYASVDTYRVDTIIPWQVDTMLSNVAVGERLMNESVKYCEGVLGIRTNYDRIHKYLWIIQDIQKCGFGISNLTDMIRRIFSMSYHLGIDVTDLDISNTNVNERCIFFDSDIKIITRNKVEMRIHLRLNYYNGEMQFIEANIFNHSINRIKDAYDFEKLMEVINAWK